MLVEDDTGDVELVFFLANHQWVRSRLPVGATRWISGKLEIYDGYRQIVHPDRVMNAEEFAKLPAVEPVYGLTEGLFQRTVAARRRGRAEAPARACRNGSATKRSSRLNLPGFAEALADDAPAAGARGRRSGRAAARPASPMTNCSPTSSRFFSCAHGCGRSSGRAHVAEGALGRRLEAALPFSLTGAQARAVEEIRADLRSEKRMIRLLQGDVGSGKTVVALLAMADVVEAGRQAAMMAPTEVLARQHFERIAPLAEKVGLRVALMTGRDKAVRAARHAGGAGRSARSTSPSARTPFSRRASSSPISASRWSTSSTGSASGSGSRWPSKGEAADLLVMTATPIPRSLVLAYFGDMDVSALREKPPGRQPIDTRAMPIERLDEVVAGLSRALAGGARAYWICPLVEESETLDAAAAEERAEALRAIFGDAVGLVHGRMAGPDKDAAMERFQRGETKILVATTVVEVGVDVPEATIMIVEHAERFGLAQLHQLRGRVGRGAGRSSCLLLYKGPLGETARTRLETLAGDGGRVPHRRRGPAPARRRRRARRPPGGRARLPFRPARNPRRAAGAGARRGAGGARAQRKAGGRREPGPAAAALSVRARRSGAADRGGLVGVEQACAATQSKP